MVLGMQICLTNETLSVFLFFFACTLLCQGFIPLSLATTNISLFNRLLLVRRHCPSLRITISRTSWRPPEVTMATCSLLETATTPKMPTAKVLAPPGLEQLPLAKVLQRGNHHLGRSEGQDHLSDPLHHLQLVILDLHTQTGLLNVQES